MTFWGAVAFLFGLAVAIDFGMSGFTKELRLLREELQHPKRIPHRGACITIKEK